ncbi:CDP-diacylglycerol--glycerol-3-phosphate 3-phosphatidyltransferase [Desulfacinum hydrothermale DSM 13146]|uniref:CDP-diacylglycerol--glycerol-3-phosphate 3-phosphatidyltransferase n=1 Tax=Desulfacinum hydrothermale DSM 13146 TaxID=1121390 RepID=A0A1W1X8A6_9BACT|nr:CDP-diacylglycerol--glycerol-3-phosphate 3-phosphatidyltransferase [Desulfacinum hydrothermale]SMC20202.1 CDP-diacylglycerol--glycerol-3-phosphate 3-phosphatidyltransferase [Desulfacinum hydrothermale DSM 13146]
MTRDEFSKKNLTALPNLLTYLRMIAIPVILVVLNPPTTGYRMNVAFVLYVMASVTDYLDGILARRYDMVTSVGKLLDPLADKLLTCGVLIMLIELNKVPGWVVFLIIGREFTITGLRSIAASQGLILDASRMGKNKMISQTIAILLLLLHVPVLSKALWILGTIFLWISVILGYWSAAGYFQDFYRKAKGLKAARESGSTQP